MKRAISFAAIAALFASTAFATTITYVTPIGSTTSGGAVDASATFVTGDGFVTLTLVDLFANPTDVAQLISDIDFVLGGVTGGFTLASSSGQDITVNSGGTYVLGSTVATGWNLDSPAIGEVHVTALGAGQPDHLIIGPADSNGVYSNANGSIANNDPHNPFLFQSATFTITNSTITADTLVTAATFSFGTTAGINVRGVPGSPPPPGGDTPPPGVPEPATLALLGLGLAGIALSRRRNV